MRLFLIVMALACLPTAARAVDSDQRMVMVQSLANLHVAIDFCSLNVTRDALLELSRKLGNSFEVNTAASQLLDESQTWNTQEMIAFCGRCKELLRQLRLTGRDI